MRTFSGLITPIPGIRDGDSPTLGEANVNSAKLLNSELQVLFGVDFFPLDADEATSSDEVGGWNFVRFFLTKFSSDIQKILKNIDTSDTFQHVLN